MKLTGKISESQDAISSHKAPRIWIIVADKHIAKIYRKTGETLEALGKAFPTVTERKKGTEDDSLGRVVSFGGSIRHKLEPHLEPGRRDAAAFAQDLSLWLEEAVRKDLFDRLVLVAAPRTLGDLRERLSKAVQARLTAEVNKELTKLSEKDLSRELKKIVWF